MKRLLALIPVSLAAACQCDRYRCRPHHLLFKAATFLRGISLFSHFCARITGTGGEDEYIYALEEMPGEAVIEPGPQVIANTAPRATATSVSLALKCMSAFQSVKPYDECEVRAWERNASVAIGLPCCGSLLFIGIGIVVWMSPSILDQAGGFALGG
ncbi:unnamed protein product [Symbiodinium natans]|uniref:Uncharacterized protein n=1 Tax=Symbiodinium natans TaxID=878477 RepID=A0A812KKX2_9DINO|nr:unnamed protein product [Symbiodinium natans]